MKRKPLKKNSYRYDIVLQQAVIVFNSAKKAKKWMNRPTIFLNGKAPRQLLKSDSGYQKVVDYLIRIQYGVY